ncbi:hypothetical protein B0H13DRAFT_1891635 [Mycena leptocephala]|nr:hypothetical protein B0H13DRAFT_1891635 [Mycena leptocephala]
MPIFVEGSQTDIVLGHDWAAFLRDSLLSLGYCVDSSFNAWQFVSYTTHPILNAPRLPLVMSDEHDSMAIDQTSPNRAASYPGRSTATSSRIPGVHTGGASPSHSENYSEISNYPSHTHHASLTLDVVLPTAVLAAHLLHPPAVSSPSKPKKTKLIAQIFNSFCFGEIAEIPPYFPFPNPNDTRRPSCYYLPLNIQGLYRTL